ncbi:MAG: SIMPL domain-containing protein [Gammaproteobacteria bacterium]|jgi:predicted secreted protein|nr:SIMPL domain-containing protein [Gammaproteobacteria bacterium]MBU0771592.1 SIMPL domain-containing protein [Gammaproteobacteria bacterium]MBU0857761.1 SIMPL domain-containing protein [Gammaproteobacteria bacterium]MBU1845324.1 SIMPL domain-containing protein [Gammaproteobacteria bacterium]
MKYPVWLLCAALLGSAHASDHAPVQRAGIVVDLNAEASRSAPNDLATAQAFVEYDDGKPATLARKVNTVIESALDTARRYPSVKVRSGNTSTYPVYAKNGRTIDGWRMRSELLLESKDQAALSELLGKLQSQMAVGQLSLQPSEEATRQAENEAIADGIAAFNARAKVVAESLGKSWRILHMNVNHTSGMPPPRPMMRGKMAMAEAVADMPMEAGESRVTVSISGQIEIERK